MRKVAIVQSCYIPWKGYFDIIKAVDHFVLYDDVQFAKRHWHNRNRIMTRQGPIWLTIPVNSKGQYLQNIDEVTVSEPWAEKHWRSIEHTYARAPHFGLYKDWLRDLYEKAETLPRLTEINELFTRAICSQLGLQTEISRSSDYSAGGRKTDRLLALCQELGADEYLSGPAAQTYFEGEKFDRAGIAYRWMDYGGYPQYRQGGPEFEHGVTVLDLMFNTGPEAAHFMKPFPEGKRRS